MFKHNFIRSVELNKGLNEVPGCINPTASQKQIRTRLVSSQHLQTGQCACKIHNKKIQVAYVKSQLNVDYTYRGLSRGKNIRI